jgi:hypothetical protein
MIIDNGKFIITNEVIANKYDIRVVPDVTGQPMVFEVAVYGGDIIFICNYISLKFFVDGVKLVILDSNFYAEFSANNIQDFNTAEILLTDIRANIV